MRRSCSSPTTSGSSPAWPTGSAVMYGGSIRGVRARSTRSSTCTRMPYTAGLHRVDPVELDSEDAIGAGRRSRVTPPTLIVNAAARRCMFAAPMPDWARDQCALGSSRTSSIDRPVASTRWLVTSGHEMKELDLEHQPFRPLLESPAPAVRRSSRADDAMRCWRCATSSRSSPCGATGCSSRTVIDHVQGGLRSLVRHRSWAKRSGSWASRGPARARVGRAILQTARTDVRGRSSTDGRELVGDVLEGSCAKLRP